LSEKCEKIHQLLSGLKRLKFPFNEDEIPLNGIYFLFEKGEFSHNADRIVRVGTHTGKDQLRSRLKQHFINENKDRSIFRKNIGRAILNKRNDPFLKYWNIDLTPRAVKEKYRKFIDFSKQRDIEKEVSEYIQKNLSFVVLRIDNKDKRLYLESRIISTISLCDEWKPSKNWLGLFSPIEKICKGGLWLVNELYKKPLSDRDIIELKKIIDVSPNII
jgi:hypothetical protein